MTFKDRLETGATATLTICALVVTVLFVKRELIKPPDPRAPHLVKGWEEYAVSNKIIGPRTAAITVVAFSDYQCPYCKQMAANLDSLVEMYPGKVRVVYRNFPLTKIHPYALEAALAAECAAIQGRFGVYHEALFADQDSLGRRRWEFVAGSAGLPDIAGFKLCLKGDRAGRAVAADTLAGRKLGITGTPTIMLNGWLFAGTPSLEQMAPVLTKLGLKPVPTANVARGE